MVDTNFTLVSGTYADEQALLGELDLFIVNTIGSWTREKVITDVATDKNIVYYTDGSETGVYDRLWVRIQATGDDLRFNTMSRFDSGTDTDYDAFGGSEASFDIEVSSTSGIYWFAANEDSVHVLVNTGTETRHGGFGHLLTCHTPTIDPKPFYVFGQTTASQLFSDADRTAMYGPHSWGTSYNATLSGTYRYYEANHPPEIAHGTPNPRSGEPKLVEPLFFTDSVFGSYEVRGEMPGLFMCGGVGITTGSIININVDPTTVSGSYLVHKYSDTYAWAIGPVTVSGGA